MAVALCLALCTPGEAQQRTRIDLQHADLLEVALSASGDTTYAIGAVVFQSEDGLIYCDSAVWLKGRMIKLIGGVNIEDPAYRLTGDTVTYDLQTGLVDSRGKYVELWSRDDSLLSVGTHARYQRVEKFFVVDKRSTLYLQYPDSANMIEVVADHMQFDSRTRHGEAAGNVTISSQDLLAAAECAVINSATNVLDLFTKPRLQRGKSVITGEMISIRSVNDRLDRILVYDSAVAEFTEPVDSVKGYTDRSTLRGGRMELEFNNGELDTVLCVRQAYSWYAPSDRGKTEAIENTVSGDTIRLLFDQSNLRRVEVARGAVGSYLSVRSQMGDSEIVKTGDTIDYQAEQITYSFTDSLITLRQSARVSSGPVQLEAHQVTFNTRARTLEAFSAQVPTNSRDTVSTMAKDLQPNAIPVVLKDKSETLYGDYLQYSLDTEKGRIVQSKSRYETGFYYGERVYRANKDVFYVNEGRFTTCDAAEPHFHFYSSDMKLMEGDKLIARPVVMSIGRLPILALPYYVFPLKKGRHSGFLPFTLGNIERGQRYVRNVGYYWAASDYWDLRAGLDYYDRDQTVTLSSRFNYAARYRFNGYLGGNYTYQGGYSSLLSQETRRRRYTIEAAHNHELAPGFKINGSGSYQSDESYYKDYSTNLSERLNRNVRSQVTFSKMFGGKALTGRFTHDVGLDTKSRTTTMPALNFSTIEVKPLGSGRSGGRHWYQSFNIRYTPSLTNISTRRTDTLDVIAGTDTTHVEYRTRKKYTRVDHGATTSLPITLFRYFDFSPSATYTENWYRIHRTDQSDSARIDPDRDYRTFIYTVGAGLKTDLFATVNPNLAGLIGLRHVFSPSVSYTYTPEINRHPDVRTYAGGGAGNARKSQVIGLSVTNLLKTKVRSGPGEKTFDLVRLTSSTSYNLEADTLNWGGLVSSFTVEIPGFRTFSGSLSHTFYDPVTGKLNLLKPRLLDFRLQTTFSFNGRTFLFDDFQAPVASVDTGDWRSPKAARTEQGRGWSVSGSWQYNESGRGSRYTHSNWVQFTASFWLTPTAQVTYSQSYDVVKGRTAYSNVQITKRLHCWEGKFYWVPTGSTRGYGFLLNVIAIPAIKIDNSQNSLNSSYLQQFQ